MRKHIFNAGPCKLPDMTLENTAKAVMELGNCEESCRTAYWHHHPRK